MTDGFGVFINVSPAGAAAVAHRPATDVDGFEFADGRRWMTNEAIAAIEGARIAGATRFLLADAHGGGLGLLLDQLPPDAEVIRSWPRPLGQMEGISTDGIAACLFVGHRTGGQSWSGALSQSFSQAGIRDVKLGGRSQSETGFNSRVAQQFGVPIVFASGDDAYVAHVNDILPCARTVITKRAISLSSAITRAPGSVLDEIRDASRLGVANRAPLAQTPPSPPHLEVEFVERGSAELLALLPDVQRTGPFTVALPAADMVQASHWLTFVCHYVPSGMVRY